MNDEVEFYKLMPQSDQLTAHDPFRVFALAEKGRQYLVFAMDGEPFSLFLGAGEYSNNAWIDAKTGARQAVPAVTGHGALDFNGKDVGERDSWPQPVRFEPPDTDTDWVLVLRRHDVKP
jgi:hypothetical protein